MRKMLLLYLFSGVFFNPTLNLAASQSVENNRHGTADLTSGEGGPGPINNPNPPTPNQREWDFDLDECSINLGDDC
jgi:hypothetical protein